MENLGMIFPQYVENSEFSEFFSEFFSGENWDSGKFLQAVFCIPREFSTGVGMFFWSLKFLLSHFVFARSLRSACSFRAAGGIRYRKLQAEMASRWSLKCSLSLGLTLNFSYFMTGRRNRAQAPSRFLPPRPSPPSGYIYGSKNWLAKFLSQSKQP